MVWMRSSRTTLRVAASVAAVAVAGGAAATLAAAGDSTGDGEEVRAARSAHAAASAFARQRGSRRRGYVRVSGDGSRRGSGTSVSASTARGRGSARARARVARVNLFGGLATARSVTVIARARGGRVSRSGTVRSLRIDGRSKGSPSGPRSYALGGYGRLAVLARRGGGIVGMRARLSRAYRGHAAGTTITIGFAAASARNATRERRPGGRDRDRGRDRRRGDRGRRAGRRPRSPSKPRRRRAPRVRALATERGYTFPVQGPNRFSNDWGAPRQHTGRHEGNDIFAPAGTPAVAVTDGRLFRVGTKRVSGNRLWLRSKRGDTFFYAHLSAFAQDARNGAAVSAGDVVGFVGSTGDAEQTPPHLHFEVHPDGGPPVNPYPFLRAWRERRDVPMAAFAAGAARPGAQPGALVVLRDFLED